MTSEAAAEQASSSWVERLAAFLADERAVEAIRLNPTEHTVSVATLGNVNEAALQERLSEILRHLDANWQQYSLHAAALKVSRQGDEVTLEKPACPTAPKLWHWRDFNWPKPDEIEQQSREEWQTLALQAAICGVALVSGYLVKPWSPTLSLAAFVVSIVAGGWDAAKDAWEKIRQRQLDIHFLMLAVAAGAAAIGEWEEGALLLFLFSFSGALEHYVLHRTHREINALTKSAPKMAHVVRADGSVVDEPVASLVKGTVIQVKPDELFAADGEVIEGETAADESALTGEALPIDKEVGAEVFSGTLNLWGLVRVRVEKPATESALQKIIQLIENAQHSRAPSQRFTDRFGTSYTGLVLALVALMFFVWWLLLKLTPDDAFYRAMTLLVVMSPCALVLSIPSAILAAIAWGAKRGILFRGGASIEHLADVNVIAMDKTGTLTEGELRVAKVESFPPGREQDILQQAVSLEASSNHPIARAITRHGASLGLLPGKVIEFQSIAGQGLRGRSESGLSYLGRRELISQSELAPFLSDIPEAPLGYSEVWVLHEKLLGRILLQDKIREGSKPVLKALTERGIRSIMLTGDRREAASKVATELGITEVRAGLHPEDKVTAIQELVSAGNKVAMVGDGVNDAPSLASAHVSLAMGARGSDAALEQADIILMQDRIEKILSALKISTSAKAIIRQNIAISLGAVVLMAISAVLTKVPLSLGVLAHEGSTVVVCLNSLRLLFVKEK
ncbi:MAG: heavy metal translocating P-type ATPase [Verrucomicrobiaceae bacterium]|nr:heavy metal translocating P-type ATPase [Verrucomicrobiaceae bacterium]